MKLGQLLEYDVRIFFFFFFKNRAENDAGRLVLGLFLLLKKVFIKEKQEFSTLVLIYFDRTRLGHKIKTSL